MINVLISSVKWGHMGKFDLEPNKHNFPTNPMGSSEQCKVGSYGKL